MNPSDVRLAHFLIVEDDDDHAALLLHMLADNHVANSVGRARDGDEALRYVRRQGPFSHAPRPDLILLDLKLPRLGGLEVLAQLKADPILRPIPVVMLTTCAGDADRRTAYGLHANSYLVKPAEFEGFNELARILGLYWSVWNVPPPTEDQPLSAAAAR